MNRWQAVLIGFLFLLLVVLVALLLAGCDGGEVGDVIPSLTYGMR